MHVFLLQPEFVAELFEFATSFSGLGLTDTEVGLVSSLLLTAGNVCFIIFMIALSSSSLNRSSLKYLLCT
jgi:uncharacterized membrane protein required for colicin V production